MDSEEGSCQRVSGAGFAPPRRISYGRDMISPACGGVIQESIITHRML